MKKLKREVAHTREVIREREAEEAAVFIWGRKTKQVLKMNQVL